MTDLDRDPGELALGFLPALLRSMDIPPSSGDAGHAFGTALYETIRQRPYPCEAPISVRYAHSFVNDFAALIGGIDTGPMPPGYLPDTMTYTQLSAAMGAVALQAFLVSTLSKANRERSRSFSQNGAVRGQSNLRFTP